MPGTPQKILVGVFGAPHGIRGEVRLKSYTGDPAAIGGYGPLYDESGARRFSIDALRPIGKDLFVARVAGVGDRSAAEALNGTELFVPRDALSALEEEEFYYADLIGLRVENEDGEIFGTVVAVHNFGAGDVLEIAPPADAANKTTAMLPFSRALVPVVDVSAARIVVATNPFAGDERAD
ncbi:MAG: rRNA processing protein RimM [Methylobacteriaceae bacterium]|nr:rRNA processing protein RimM [Methylobacteriaceae bacterium]